MTCYSLVCFKCCAGVSFVAVNIHVDYKDFLQHINSILVSYILYSIQGLTDELPIIAEIASVLTY